METTKHTQEPWACASGSESFEPITGANGSPIFEHGYDGMSFNHEDARRIVACVNACRGLDTIELEQAGLASAFGNQLLDLEQQVAELSEQLEGQQALNGRLQSENQALSARVVSRVDELQQATQARLAAERQRDELLAECNDLRDACRRAINYSENVARDQGVYFDDDGDLPFIRAAFVKADGEAARRAMAKAEADTGCKSCHGGPQWGHAWDCPELP